MTEAAPATTITAEQIAELKELVAKMEKQQGCLALQDMDKVLPILPALVAVAEEAERLRADIDRVTLLIGQMAMAFPNPLPIEKWPAEIGRLSIEEKDAKALRCELFHLTAERDAAHAAGRKEGLGKAAEIFNKRAADLKVALPGFRPDGEDRKRIAAAIDQAMAESAAILALIQGGHDHD
jgi:hypothetical protein